MKRILNDEDQWIVDTYSSFVKTIVRKNNILGVWDVDVCNTTVYVNKDGVEILGVKIDTQHLCNRLSTWRVKKRILVALYKSHESLGKYMNRPPASQHLDLLLLETKSSDEAIDLLKDRSGKRRASILKDAYMFGLRSLE